MKTDTPSLNTVCAPSKEIAAREIEGELILTPLAAGMDDSDDESCTLNESGKAVWARLDGTRTLAEVVDALTQEFEAPRADLEADVLSFAREMLRRGILVVVIAG